MAGPARNTNNHRLYLLGAMLVFWGWPFARGWCICRFFPTANSSSARSISSSGRLRSRRGGASSTTARGHELAMSVAVESAFAVPSEIHDWRAPSR